LSYQKSYQPIPVDFASLLTLTDLIYPIKKSYQPIPVDFASLGMLTDPISLIKNMSFELQTNEQH
jgi:hypothetical protein